MNLAIIGCGRVAMHHCNAILKVNKLKLVSVCDFNEERGKILADKYKVKFFTNYNEMLEKLGDTIDIVKHKRGKSLLFLIPYHFTTI